MAANSHSRNEGELKLRAPQPMINALRAAAVRHGRTYSGEIRFAVREHLAREKRERNQEDAATR